VTSLAAPVKDGAGTRSAAKEAKKRERGRGFYIYLCAGTVLALLFVLPLLWVIVRSLEPSRLSGVAPSAADFTHLTVSNYSTLLIADNLLVNVLNSLIAAVGTAALTVVVSTMAGYGLARFRFRGAGLVFAAILLAFMIPFQAVLTPLFLELHFFHLLNSLLGLVLIYSTFSLPFGVFVMRNSFAQVPREIIDSSRVDGAGVVTALVRVMRPLVIPGMATTAIYAFLYAWTELLQAYTFLTSSNLMTLPVRLFNVITQQSLGVLNYGYLASGVVIAMVPCILLYMGLQRYYVQGLTSGALKG
jgi:multiple sugar transport system permease protein